MGNGKYKEWVTQEGLIKLEGFAKEGLTDEQIAHNVGINRTTLYEWKRKHSCIADALKKGKEVVDYEVENALLKRAMGYKFTEITKELTKDKGFITTKEVIKEVPPDTTAQIFWLKNRKPELWRDKKDINMDNKVKLNMSNQELDKELDKLEVLLEGE